VCVIAEFVLAVGMRTASNPLQSLPLTHLSRESLFSTVDSLVYLIIYFISHSTR